MTLSELGFYKSSSIADKIHKLKVKEISQAERYYPGVADTMINRSVELRKAITKAMNRSHATDNQLARSGKLVGDLRRRRNDLRLKLMKAYDKADQWNADAMLFKSEFS